MLDAGDGLHDLLDLSSADITSYRQDKVLRAETRVKDLEMRCQQLRDEAERVPIRSPLDGNDLMEIFAREPGPWLRPLKDYLLGLVIDGQLAPDDRDEATKLATAFLEQQEQQQTAAASHESAAPTPSSQSESPDERRATRAARRHQSRQSTPGELQPAGKYANDASASQTAPVADAKETEGDS
jgi:poly(A) polymerase